VHDGVGVDELGGVARALAPLCARSAERPQQLLVGALVPAEPTVQPRLVLQELGQALLELGDRVRFVP
jgi:hypothetical protein